MAVAESENQLQVRSESEHGHDPAQEGGWGQCVGLASWMVLGSTGGLREEWNGSDSVQVLEAVVVADVRRTRGDQARQCWVVGRAELQKEWVMVS